MFTNLPTSNVVSFVLLIGLFTILVQFFKLQRFHEASKSSDRRDSLAQKEQLLLQQLLSQMKQLNKKPEGKATADLSDNSLGRLRVLLQDVNANMLEEHRKQEDLHLRQLARELSQQQQQQQQQQDVRKLDPSTVWATEEINQEDSEKEKPTRILIISSWRTGSTFFGSAIYQHPKMFYHYEPMHYKGIRILRSGILAQEANKVLNRLFHCDYKHPALTKYLGYAEFGWKGLFGPNQRYMKKCHKAKGCWERSYLTGECKASKHHVVKATRIRANNTEQLLNDSQLNVKVLLLVRDPRGTINSRKSTNWCGASDCASPRVICKDMEEDFHTRKKLSKLYPQSFRALRYEDLSRQPAELMSNIFSQIGLSMVPEVKDFLSKQTQANHGDMWSTSRNSSSTPYHWRTELKWPEVDKIQRDCAEAMRLWGYNECVEKDLDKCDSIRYDAAGQSDLK